MTTTRTAGAQLIADELEHRILTGGVKQGEYLASVRSLSKEFRCAPLTAHRALRHLVEKGLVEARPREGYRVAAPGRAGQAREVVAFLEDTVGYGPHLGDIYDTQLSALRRGASVRGWASVVLPYEGQAAGRIAEQLDEMGATALILQDVGERFPPELAAELVALGLPAVSLDMVTSAVGLDQVVRDEAHGATLATERLIAGGHRRIGWYGPLAATFNSRRRFAGAAEALLRAGLEIDAQGWWEVENADQTAVARSYLSSPDRPKAVLALWQTAAMALACAARELGLKLGTDLEVVGWSLEEHFDRGYAADCPELREASATVTWSMTEVGRLALNRIAERRREPDLPAARILVPMRLREPRR
jgi:DNA-binding LacI/PurR family transcriptional regulator